MLKKYLSNGMELAERGEFREAALSFCHAIKLNPEYPEAYQRLGEVLMPLERWDDAQASFCKAIELKPHYPEAYNQLGVVLKQKNYLVEAEACYRQAVAQNPDYAEAFHNLGNCLKLTNRLDEAEAAYSRALELRADLYQSKFSLATLYLLRGQYQAGWKLYETRFICQGRLRLDIPIWKGEDLTNRKILLFYEQGFGDMIQFIRYAYKVAELSAETTVWIQTPLKRLLDNGKNNFFVCCNSRNIEPKQFDYACSLFSLPLMFNTSRETIPNTIPYIHAFGDSLLKWCDKIGKVAGERYKVGVVWAGNPEHSDDHNRSIPLEVFSLLFDVQGVEWISLQLGEAAQEAAQGTWNILDFSEELSDFAETAGIIDNLDLIIAVDTAVAHLAGAMGKKTWLLLPYVPDWRWGLECEQTPWYPTMHLFRQQKKGDWQEVIARVKTALRSLEKSGQ